jgi:hypothetical protein
VFANFELCFYHVNYYTGPYVRYIILGFTMCSIYRCFIIVSWKHLVSHVLNILLKIVLWVLTCSTQHTDKQSHKRGKGRPPLVVERNVKVKTTLVSQDTQLPAKADEKQICIDIIT